jgi:DNA modification methylase
MPDESVNCIITSPPYWGLRAYGTEPQIWQNGNELCIEHQWGVDTIMRTGRKDQDRNTRNTDGRNPLMQGVVGAPKMEGRHNICSACGAWRGELGLEPTPELYVAHITQILREARRVLREDGTLWLNIGDSYGTGTTAPRQPGSRGISANTQLAQDLVSRAGGVAKQLIGIPWRVAFALQADGWCLRQDIIWHKPNPMPESVKDRCTKSHEYIFLLTKSARYYFNSEAITEPGVIPAGTRGAKGGSQRWSMEKINSRPPEYKEYNGRRNKRSVWTVTTKPFGGAHFATFPPKLIEPMVLAGCPHGGAILDLFSGAGTTGLVALQHGRDYIGLELNPEYIEIARARIDKVQTQMELA